MDLMIITGLSGAGKSRVVDALEDIGYFCVDNMPPKLMPTFAQLLLNSRERRDKVAIVTDIRVGGSFGDLFNALVELREMNCSPKILFVDASDDVLIRRYKETRRKHPLLEKYNGSITEALAAEREILEPAKSIADYIIDSSYMTPTECKNRVCEMFMENPRNALKVHCISFGFKYGIPNDSDLLFDVRCLPNPFYVSELKEHTGLEAPVKDYVLKWEEAQGLAAKLCDLMDYLIPLYNKEGKSQLVISVGCTGGRHRSVVFAQLLKEHLDKLGCIATVHHRDMKK
ncbi:MAG: RNase adapter RapZ [Clostridia bacterium]|nr:RNase adapter RapZ [Clostridia bacterium]